MTDFINKKLKSTYKGEFDIKKYNENLSEFMIFFFYFPRYKKQYKLI